MANPTAAKTIAKPKGEGLWQRFVKFIRECYIETWHKSSWPSRTELRQFVIVVLFALFVVAAWIGVADFILTKLTAWLNAGR